MLEVFEFRWDVCGSDCVEMSVSVPAYLWECVSALHVKCSVLQTELCAFTRDCWT